MKTSHSNLFLPTLLAAGLIACSGGGGDQVAGIGGSGYISTGTVTGFGSVFVNGVEFETDASSFEVEDSSSSQSALKVGMVVQVNGSVNPDGISGDATEIRFGDLLDGPVASRLGETGVIPNADGTQKLFRVLGTNVIVDAVDTTFDGTNFDFNTIVLNNTVEISGFYDENQVLRATYIHLKSANFNPAEDVEIEGLITNLSGTTFNINNVIVNAASATSVPENGLLNAIYVEVKGTYDVASNTITAQVVEQEDLDLRDDGEEISLEGYITRYVSDADFDISGITVNASTATFEPLTLQLATGIKVEAEGSIINQVFMATKIETRTGDAEIHATILNVPPATAAGTFTISAYSGAPAITVVTTTSTNMEDALLELKPFNVSDLGIGEFVEIVGFEDGAASSITATKLKRREVATDHLLQGFATAMTGSSASGTITVLGVPYTFDSGTSFQDGNEVPLTTQQIDNLVSTIDTTDTLVKIKDVSGDGTAEEIDLED